MHTRGPEHTHLGGIFAVNAREELKALQCSTRVETMGAETAAHALYM